MVVCLLSASTGLGRIRTYSVRHCGELGCELGDRRGERTALFPYRCSLNPVPAGSLGSRRGRERTTGSC